MKKFVVWILALGGALVVITIAAVLLIPQFIDIESYKPEIEKKVTELTGRSFTLGGDLDLSIFPWAAVSFTDLHLGNQEEYGTGDFVSVKSFEARVKLLPLLSKKIEVKKFVLDGPEIFLEKDGTGRMNWVNLGKGTLPPSQETVKPQEKKSEEKRGDLALSSLEVGEFSVINGRISYVDKALGSKNEITDITFTLQDVSLERPVSLLFQANVDGKPVTMKGSVGPVGKKIGKETVKIDLVLDVVEHLKINLKGSVEDPVEKQKFDLTLKVTPFSPRDLLASLNRQLPIQTADPAVLTKVALDLNVQGDPDSVILKKSSVTLDDSNLQIEAVVKDMAKPDVKFRLDLDSINLDRYLPPKPEKKETTAGKTAEVQVEKKTAGSGKQEKIDYTPLRNLVLQGDVTVGSLTAHGAKMSDLVMKLTGSEGVFALDPCTINLYQGSIDLVGNFNVQGERPKGMVDLQVEKIEVGPFLKDSVKKDILEGTMTATTGIAFEGDDAEFIKKNLNGKGNLSFIDGAIVGLDLAGMVRNVQAGFGADKPIEKPRTDFAELAVPFVLTKGIFATGDTRLLSPLLRVKAAGTADLVNERLNLKVRPKLVGTLKGQGDAAKHAGVVIPILVEGSFAEPEYSADLSGLVSEQSLKDAAKDPEGTVEKAKALEESGKQLLKSMGFGN